MAAHLTVVGNLIGLQTVDIAPRTGGRLLSVNVQLGDRVRRGQVLAKVEDREIVEQVRAAEASQEVAKATIRQREADLKVAELNFERSKNLFARQLLAKQALDDAESRYLAAVAQLDLSKAQLSRRTTRASQELRINLQHTSVTSPVDGFVGKRNVDPGAMVNTNTAIASVVDISRLQLVVNVVEKDLRMVNAGDVGDRRSRRLSGREVQRPHRARRAGARSRDAHRVDGSRNPEQRQPAEARHVCAHQPHRRGAQEHAGRAEERGDRLREQARRVDAERRERRAQFVPVTLGIEGPEQIEILGGLKEGDRFVTTGAARGSQQRSADHRRRRRSGRSRRRARRRRGGQGGDGARKFRRPGTAAWRRRRRPAAGKRPQGDQYCQTVQTFDFQTSRRVTI